MFSRVRIAIRFFFVGLAVGVLLAPRSGEETRRQLTRNMRKLRAMTEEKLDELIAEVGPAARARRSRLDDGDEGELDESHLADTGADTGEHEAPVDSARAELERRLAQARARRRRVVADDDDDEEPLA